jgi:L-lactate dehydrogenase
MSLHINNRRKVVIVGAGDVGSTFAFALANSSLAEEIVLVDNNENLARGQALDLAHGMPFFQPLTIRSGSVADYADASFIAITAGAKQKPGESRLSLLQRNAEIIRSIMADIEKSASQAVVLVVSNPVDILTHVAQAASAIPDYRIIGSGTVLDSARFRYMLSNALEIDAKNIHGYILGEHGDSEFAAWSMTHIAGVPIDTYAANISQWQEIRSSIEEQVRHSAYHIIDYKGSTYYGVGMAMVQIAGAVLRRQRRVLSVSTRLNGEYGINDICISAPCIVSGKGIEEVISSSLLSDELDLYQKSAAILQESVQQLTLTV